MYEMLPILFYLVLWAFLFFGAGLAGLWMQRSRARRRTAALRRSVPDLRAG